MCLYVYGVCGCTYTCICVACVWLCVCACVYAGWEKHIIGQIEKGEQRAAKHKVRLVWSLLSVYLFVRVYICVLCIRMYVCTYVRVYEYVPMYCIVCLWLRICTFVWISVWMDVHQHMYGYMKKINMLCMHIM